MSGMPIRLNDASVMATAAQLESREARSIPPAICRCAAHVRDPQLSDVELDLAMREALKGLIQAPAA
jgi:hypothetical protein